MHYYSYFLPLSCVYSAVQDMEILPKSLPSKAGRGKYKKKAGGGGHAYSFFTEHNRTPIGNINYLWNLCINIPFTCTRSFRKNKDQGNHLHRQESLRPYGYSSEPNSYRALSQPSPSGLQPLESPHSYL